MHTKESQSIIGTAERIQLIGYDDQLIPAKVDTGADLSSLWASNIAVTDGVLSFTLFAKDSPYYTGKLISLHAGEYRVTKIVSSFGHQESRYAVKLPVRILDRKIRVTFTLSDRSKKIYPILLGKRMLKGKFLVDVEKGKPLTSAERAYIRSLAKHVIED